ncbi:50S ribosomal protein L9 [Treponema brennaborense]|uniref:Large ribosomal subunit protein bL9 n=1 Tax=Treponema brennaborense (strain DSM 12168 / CIP 105900 / DD5/3) TaxID=906968 RepID=F4LN88_TREBD|nr:50S ribosomal protein L9 [Treponema brennaborense]AEE16853.1 50S ribosomal protein L9 [Treponema brennaborense DSM 12168]
MKVILNQDVKHLGEEGDVKVVANGYARNYLFPRNLALPFNDVTVAYFENRKEEIENRKAAKRRDAAGIKEKLEAFTIELAMPAGSNGKLYGAVTNQTVADELQKNGFEIERKRIEIPGVTIKSVGKYHAVIRLYETASAEMVILVRSQEEAAKAAESAAKEETAAKEEAAPAETSENTQAE